HDGPVAAAEIQHTDNPPLAGERPADALPLVVKATAVAHECPAALGRDQFAQRRYSILFRQNPLPFPHAPARTVLVVGASSLACPSRRVPIAPTVLRRPAQAELLVPTNSTSLSSGRSPDWTNQSRPGTTQAKKPCALGL